MQSTARYHLVATTDQDGDRTRVGAVLNVQHAVFARAKGGLADLACLAELGSRHLLKAGDDAATSGDGDELELGATDPADGWELVLHQQVVGLVVKAPLAHNQVGARVLDLFIIIIILFDIFFLFDVYFLSLPS